MHIIVDDPSREYWPGALVQDDVARVLATREVTSLPVVPELLKHGAVGGYFKREWGAGWPLDTAVPRMHCPMLLRVEPGYTRLHWAVRLALNSAVARPPAGTLRLAADSSQAYAQTGALSPAENIECALSALPKADARGGWTHVGAARVTVSSAGYCGLALYGYGAGVSVVWGAVALAV